MSHNELSGVYAAALTPLHPDLSPEVSALTGFLKFLARRGCHGALLLGTTGEGPSFSPEQRTAIFRAALEIRQEEPGFRLLAGTGTPSLEETIGLTKAAFDLGFDGVLVLPPYYFRKASEEGLLAWFSTLMQRAVPSGGAVLGYHIPDVSGVPLTLDLLARLKDRFPDRFAGLKDSSGDRHHAQQLGERFGRDLTVLTGSDSLFSLALASGASGCITAPANLISPLLRQIWEAHQCGESDGRAQARVNEVRECMQKFTPYPPLLKALLARSFGFPHWTVCPPLLPLSAEEAARAEAEIDLSWLD